MVIVEQQDQIEVFWNDAGLLTIKQMDGVAEESVVVFTRQNVEGLLLGLRNALEKERD